MRPLGHTYPAIGASKTHCSPKYSTKKVNLAETGFVHKDLIDVDSGGDEIGVGVYDGVGGGGTGNFLSALQRLFQVLVVLGCAVEVPLHVLPGPH